LDEAASVKLRFTKRAARQIDAIIDHIAVESPQGARRVRERMHTVTALLVDHPHMGQLTDLENVRRAIVSPYPYMIFYRVTADAIIIQRVRHTSRAPSTT
jgi:toxin ParE1/3/4